MERSNKSRTFKIRSEVGGKCCAAAQEAFPDGPFEYEQSVFAAEKNSRLTQD
jgi:hypothetical protein